MATSTGPAPARSTGRRLDSLTGLRWFAALGVFLSHVGPSALFADQSINANLYRLFANAGGAAVSFFFILSGFVLTLSLRKNDTPGRFIRRRLVKIFPNHVVAWVGATFVVWFAAFSWGPALANLTLVHSWVPRFEFFFSPNPVSWSLSCELLFYVAFPFIIPAVQRIRPERLWAWAIGAGAAIFAAVLFAVQVIPSTPTLLFPIPGVGLYQYWFVYLFPVTRLLEFALGILLARIVLNGRWIRIGVLPAAVLVVAAYVLSTQAPPLLGLTAIMALPMALLIGAVGWSDLSGKRLFLASRPMVWLGEISFAFYLIHLLVLGYRTHFESTFFSVGGGIAVTLAALLIAITLSAALYYAVERPMVRRFSNPRTPVTTGTRTTA